MKKEIPQEIIQKWVSLYRDEDVQVKNIAIRFQGKYGESIIAREIKKALGLKKLTKRNLMSDGWCAS